MNPKLEQFLKEHKDLNILFLCKFGSHLYGTSTEDSDEDYKGVFLPTKEECYLNQISQSFSYTSGDNFKNSKDDIDIELYSLQYYLELLYKGDTGALDMLHAKSYPEMIMIDSKEWNFLYKNRSDFYTKNLSAFIGYCRTQASKYGIKGSRLNAAEKVVKFLGGLPGSQRLESIWDLLPEGEHIHKFEPTDSQNYRFYQVCGRKLQETVTADYAYNIVKKFYDEYGARAKKAANNEGIDWKACSHALRCAYQMQSIYRHGDIKFPLDQVKILLLTKRGDLDYMSEFAPRLELLMDNTEILAQESKYPMKVNQNKFQKFLINLYESKIFKNDSTLLRFHWIGDGIDD